MSLSKRVQKERLQTLRNGKFMIAHSVFGKLSPGSIQFVDFAHILTSECSIYEHMGKMNLGITRMCYLIENNKAYNINRWIHSLYNNGYLVSSKTIKRGQYQYYKLVEA